MRFSMRLAAVLTQAVTIVTGQRVLRDYTFTVPGAASTTASGPTAGTTGVSNATATVSSPSPTASLGARATFGLPASGMQRNGLYFGMLPDWDFYGPSDVTRTFGEPVSIMGDYITISQADTSLSQIYYHQPSLEEYRSNTVYAPAIIPANGVGNANFTQAMATALAQAFKTLNNNGVVVWCRFAYEMNGYWNNYGQQPDSFKESWQLLYTTVKQVGAPNTYFLWSPNVWTNNISDPVNGYTNYYPGDEYVDIAGLSLYYFGDSTQTLNVIPSNDTFSSLLQSFYDEYYTSHSKPIVISESSSPYHYNLPAGFVSTGNDTEIAQKYQSAQGLTPAGGGAGQEPLKQSWLEELTGADTASAFPGLVAVSWFNVFKNRNNQLMDFRGIFGDNATETYFRTTLGTSSGQPSGGSPASSAAPSLAALSPLALTFVTIAIGAFSFMLPS